MNQENYQIASDSELSNAEIERFLLLAEECNEVSQIVMKILRFGKNNYHPRTKAVNIDRLREELTDLIAIYNLMLHGQDFVPILDDEVEMAMSRKAEYMLHNDLGQSGPPPTSH